MLAVNPGRKDSPPKNLWFYKDGLRSPVTPAPTSSKLVLGAMRENGGTPETDSVQNGGPTTCTASLVISPSCNRRQIEVAPENIMSQSMTTLPHTSPIHPLMTNSFSGVFPKNSPSFSSNLTLTPLHSESRLSGSEHRRSKPAPPPRTTPVNGEVPPPLPPKSAGGERVPPPRPASKELKLDDILMMCKEYEKQIEEEQRVALSLSFTSTPVSKDPKGFSRRFFAHPGEETLSPFALDPVALSPSGESQITPLNPLGGSEVTPLSPLQREGLMNEQPPLSPSSTLQQSRIKTNGSLPRDGKRGPSPARSLPPNSPHTSLPPTSPHASDSDLFNWDTEATSQGSYLTHPAASPRTRIRTTVGKCSRESSAETLRPEGGSSCNNSPAHTLRSSAHNSPASNLNSPAHTLKRPVHSQKSPGHSVNNPVPSLNNNGGVNLTKGQLVNGQQQRNILSNGHCYNGHEVNNGVPTYPNGLSNGNPVYGMINGDLNSVYSQSQATTNDSVTQFSLSDYQGGKEDMFDTDGKSKEELYTEAKDILNMVSTQYTRKPESLNRSNLDESSLSSNTKMIIGTGMLGLNRNGNSEDLSKLRAERDETLVELNRTTHELAEIELQIEEANRSVDMESSLLGAELSTQLLNLDALRDQVESLRRTEFEMLEAIEAWREGAAKETEGARARLLSLECSLELLEQEQSEGQGILDTDKELELLEKIKVTHERLEAERRIFEDLEFQQMEHEAVLEHDREEVISALCSLESRVRGVEADLQEVEQQQQQISYSQEDVCMADKREEVSSKLQEQQDKLSQLEEKLQQLLSGGSNDGGNRRSNDSGTITWSDEETNTIKTEHMDLKPRGVSLTSPGVQLSSPGVQLNSAGSGEDSTDSTSDLPQDSSSTTPSPNVRRFRKRSPSPQPNKRLTKRSSMQRTSDRILEIEGLTSADESRPMSTDLSISLDTGGITDASSWIGEGVIMRQGGGATSRATRPLTRYLPVTTQENFDLRSHIESAGHQIELCRHIVLNSCSCRGYLSKMGARLKVWTKRWFVFDRNKRTLVYYNDKSESKVKGGIYFHSISEVYVDHQNNRTASQRVTFCMKTVDRSYLLMAPTPEAMRVWVDVLFTGAEGYREYQE